MESSIVRRFLFSAAFLLCAVVALLPVRADILLSDIVGGGDGSGNAPPEYVGINADDGTFRTAYIFGNVGNTGDNPQIVDDEVSPYIDAVFVMDLPTMVLNSGGVTFDFQAGDENGTTWDQILKDRTNDVDKGSTDFPIILSPGQPPSIFKRGIGLHASAGITFDLEA